MRVKKFLQNLRSFDKMLSVKKEVVCDRLNLSPLTGLTNHGKPYFADGGNQ
jgi:hypothetical protein